MNPGLGQAAQDRAILRMAQVHHALVADIDPVDPLGTEECPVRAAEILQDPGIPFDPKNPVPP
jgi:hypothetical protein